MWIHYFVLFGYLLNISMQETEANKRQKRYLLFTTSTQWGVFITVSVPLTQPENTVSVAWFFEANYYNVANATYFEPLLGDITIASRSERSVKASRDVISRNNLYIFIENMLEKHGHPGRSCLLRAICESAASHFAHNGVLGDLLHLILTRDLDLRPLLLTDIESIVNCKSSVGRLGWLDKRSQPSTSISEEDVDDSFYEAEYLGLEDNCDYYENVCPISPLEYISVNINGVM